MNEKMDPLCSDKIIKKHRNKAITLQMLTQIFLVSFTSFISSSLYPFESIGALWENKLKAYCIKETDKKQCKS